MKLSELITHAQEMIKEHGDHEIGKAVAGTGNFHRASKVEIDINTESFVKRKTVTAEGEEITTKRREPVYRIKVEDDIKRE